MRKVVDGDGKLFGKINLLDFIILLILAIAIIGGCYKLFLLDNSAYTPEYQQGQITLELMGLTERQMDAVKMGDLVRVPKIQDLGTISHIDVEHSIEQVSSSDGNVYSVENPLLYDLTITLETDKLFFRDEFFYVGKQYKLNKGMSLEISNGLMPCKAVVQSVKIEK